MIYSSRRTLFLHSHFPLVLPTRFFPHTKFKCTNDADFWRSRTVKKETRFQGRRSTFLSFQRKYWLNPVKRIANTPCQNTLGLTTKYEFSFLFFLPRVCNRVLYVVMILVVFMAPFLLSSIPFLTFFRGLFPPRTLPIYIALDLAIYPLGMRGREREGASLGMHRTIMSREKLRTLRKCGRRSSGFLSPPLIFVKTDVAPVSRRGCGNF